MKGFNLATPGTQGMNTLPPVAEFMAPFHSGSENDPYGSAFAGLLSGNAGITPRRNPMYSMQQYSSSQSSFSESFGTMGRLGKIGSKLRNTSQKRRWGNKNHIESHYFTFFFIFIEHHYSNFTNFIHFCIMLNQIQRNPNIYTNTHICDYQKNNKIKLHAL